MGSCQSQSPVARLVMAMGILGTLLIAIEFSLSPEKNIVFFMDWVD